MQSREVLLTSHTEGVVQAEPTYSQKMEGLSPGKGTQIGHVAGKFIPALVQHRYWDRESKTQMAA